MFKTIWAALKEQTRLIGQNPAAAYGAVMTAVVVLLFAVAIKLGILLIEAKDQLINKEATHSLEKSVILMQSAGYVLRAQDGERAAMDTASKYRYLYLGLHEQSQNSKN